MDVKVYDGTTNFIDSLSRDILDAVTPLADKQTIPDLQPSSELYEVPDIVYSQINAALKAGKRHLILYGPPGTGKTTLAKYLAEQLSSSGEYEMLTASSSWTSQELIGGYQPIGKGEIGFRPGAILRNFDKPIVIDELNRCPIDKVIGPLFSVLSGQDTTLPYKVDIADESSPFHVIFPEWKEERTNYEWTPGYEWRLIATLNTVDKSQLGQISYALSRRFAWIKIGVPEDIAKSTRLFMDREADATLPNPIADLWEAVNMIRPIGGAPIIDCIRTLEQLKPGIDLLVEPDEDLQDLLLTVVGMYILPLLDGVRRVDAQRFIESITKAWRLSTRTSDILRNEMVDFIA